MRTRPTRLRLVAVLVAVAGLLALALASASPALRSAARKDSAAARRASIAPLPPLEIFSRPQSRAEHDATVAGEVREMLDALPATEPATLRFALLRAGASERKAFVVHTTDGRICAGLTHFTSGCLQGLPREMPVDVTYGGETATEGPIVWGIARDDVRAVEVIVNGQTYSATLGRNAYFFQAPAGTTANDLQFVRARLAGGSVLDTTIG